MSKERVTFAQRNITRFDLYNHIRPICLPADDSNDYNDFVATVTGWGTTSSGGSTSNRLREVNVVVMTNQECKVIPISKHYY